MNDESKDVFGDSTLELSIIDGAEQQLGSDDDKVKEIVPNESKEQSKDTDPVHTIPLSQNCFAADSDDDDDVSLIIPPTQMDDTVPFIIPSTPTDNETIDETSPFLDDSKKSEAEKESKDDDEWNKATQPLCLGEPETQEVIVDDDNNDETFADTEDMFTSYMDMPTQRQSTPVIPEQEDSEEWNLRLTATQTSQPLLDNSPAKEPSTEEPKNDPIIEMLQVDHNVEVADIVEVEDDPTDMIETQVITEEITTSVVKEENENDLEVNKEIDDKEGTPEDVRLFAEIENIVKAARESEKISSQESVKEEPNEADSKGNDDSDLDEIAPSQTSSTAPSICTAPPICEKILNVPTDTIVPETEPSLEDSEEDKNDHTLLEVAETEQFGAANMEEVDISAETKVELLPKSSLEKSPKKVTINPDLDFMMSSEISVSQPNVLNGQNIISSSPFRQPNRFFKKPQRTPQKIKPLGRILNDTSPKFELKSGDTKDVTEMLSRKRNPLLQPSSIVGSFSDAKSLEKLLNSVGVTIDEEKLKNHSSPAVQSVVEKDVIRVSMAYRIYLKGDKVWDEFSLLDDDYCSQSKIEVSPLNSSSTTSSTKSSFISTGEMGDISSSISSKSQGSNASSSQNEVQIIPFQRGDVGFPLNAFKKSPLDHHSSSSQEDFKSPVNVLPKKGKSTSTPTGYEPSGNPRGRPKKNSRKQNSRKRSTELVLSTGDELEAKRAKRDESNQEDSSLSSNDTVVRAVPKKGSTKKKAGEGKKKNTRKKQNEVVEAVVDSSTSSEALPPIVEDTGGIIPPNSSILPGMRVMARWKDGYFYPGIVQSLETDGRWRVEFDDGGIRTVIQENLLKIALLQVGTRVLAMSPDGYYDPGVVASHYRDESDMGYVVEQANGLTRRYKRGAVILSTEQAKVLTSDKPSSTLSALTTINLENIIGGKRKRKSLQDPIEPVKAPEPPPKKSTRRVVKTDLNLDTTESSANEAITSQNDIVLAIEEQLRAIGEGDREEPVQPKPTHSRKTPRTKKISKTTSKGSRKQGKKVAQLSSSDTSEAVSNEKLQVENDAGIAPIRRTKLFQGYAFLLTHAVKKNVEENAENFAADMIFDKEQLCKTIMVGGGLALDTFDDAMKCTNKKVILLANTHWRTIKYLQCVAANIPCVQQFWVQHCVRECKITSLDNYVLPAGYSIVDDKISEWHGKTDIFKGLKIVITSEKKSDFVNIWTPVLLAAKAELVQKWTMPSFQVTGTSFVVDLIVTNASCPASIIAAAKRGKIPVVSSEYIIQCIIVGHRLPYDAHPKFKHDFKE